MLHTNSTESKRVYKTLLRSCLKQKPSDNVKNFYQPNKHAHLFRSPSTPSLKRIWICHACELENNSVTWHCLNCECVSYLAPIYKETLRKKDSNDLPIVNSSSSVCGGDVVDSSTAAIIPTTAATVVVASSVTANTKIRNIMLDDSAMSNNTTTTTTAANPQKCHLCLYKTKPSSQLLAGKEPICRHQNRSKYLRFPMIGARDAGGGVGSGLNAINPNNVQHQNQQTSFDDGKHYEQSAYRPPHDGLYYSNRKINKSLSSISDFDHGDLVVEPMIATGAAATASAGVFGERILSRPNRTNVTDAVRKQLSRSQYHIGGTEKQLPSLLCEICGVCNHNRCPAIGNSGGCAPPPTSQQQSATSDTISRFTITTLSRMGNYRGGAAVGGGAGGTGQSNHPAKTLSRNGGVFVAVRDWSAELPKPIHQAPLPATDSYYEILKNPNNNPPYENQSIINKTKEIRHLYENHPLPQQQQQSQEPIYAVVNKTKKSRNKLMTQQSEPKFSCVGTNSENKPHSEPESLYASIGGGTVGALNNNLHRLSSLDDTGTDGDLKSSHVTISSSIDHPGSDTSEIYAKVWKGPRKSLDSQKM